MNTLYVPLRGRPRKVKTPQELMKIFLEYVKDREERTIHLMETEVGVVGDNTIQKDKNKKKNYPLTILDFQVYLGVGEHWFNQLPEEFSYIKSIITNYIKSHQMNGSLIGEYNANIISRMLGLAEKVEHTGETATIIVRDASEKKKIETLSDLTI